MVWGMTCLRSYFRSFQIFITTINVSTLMIGIGMYNSSISD